ncbi:MAG: helicase [Saprospiraceae bacterium]|nr:MAG: helicase [Saprospiraceae bacterium]
MNSIPNPQLDLAFDYVRTTDKNIFLTGKAGTGKTTFLHSIKKEGFKRMVVVAPTGVAAINAGGMTIHSFFQLPFGLHLPGNKREGEQRRFSGKKISLIRSLDLLVIDEISMVRADMLDSVDEVLRRYRGNQRPFGGVQLLMIGDLHQLPPVVKQEEWDLLRQHYQTPYFFGSIALQKTAPVTIELKHIYRQSDSRFIELLNKVRNNHLDTAVLDALNSRYRADFHPPEEDGYITLTSHNAAAHEINAQKLAAIEEPVHIFKAKIEGDFPAHAYPTEETLEFKKAAQVMFVKNDLSPEKRYYNGKIGQITKIEKGVVCVKCPGEATDIQVSPITWDNVKYTLNEQTKEVKEEIIGAFTQYPLKLAWAITIHKSQGLTFERAIIDAQAAFAFGQVYVALSRCKSFEGLVLHSKIAYSSVKTDSVVKTYTEEAEKNAPSEADLKLAKREYQHSLLLELFDFKTTRRYFDQLNRQFLEHQSSLQGTAFAQLKALEGKAREQVLSVADKFLPQLSGYFQQTEMPEELEPLQQRLQKASVYFSEKLSNELLPEAKKIQILTDNKAVQKTVLELLDNLQKELFVKNACFVACHSGFSTQNYTHAKVNAELDFAASKSVPPPASAFARAPQNTPHPELYAQLLEWRKEVAAENGSELYEVLPIRSLLELVQFLPTNTTTLKKIKGIGEVKARQFGAAIIHIIENFCQAKQIPANLLVIADAPKELKPDTKAVSFELFKAGKTIDEIAKERGFVRGTIEGHLAHYVGTGEVDIFSLMERGKVVELEAFFTANPAAVSSEARAHFQEKYSYSEIKMVMEYLKGNQKPA